MIHVTCSQRSLDSLSSGTRAITGPKIAGPSSSSSTMVGTPKPRSEIALCSAIRRVAVSSSAKAHGLPWPGPIPHPRARLRSFRSGAAARPGGASGRRPRHSKRPAAASPNSSRTSTATRMEGTDRSCCVRSISPPGDSGSRGRRIARRTPRRRVLRAGGPNEPSGSTTDSRDQRRARPDLSRMKDSEVWSAIAAENQRQLGRAGCRGAHEGISSRSIAHIFGARVAVGSCRPRRRHQTGEEDRCRLKSGRPRSNTPISS